MCIISKQILLYGSDVQLYNEKAFQNNIKSIIGGYTVLPLSVRSSQDVHNIFLSNYLWQQSDI
jgi:hypothetical protein